MVIIIIINKYTPKSREEIGCIRDGLLWYTEPGYYL